MRLWKSGCVGSGSSHMTTICDSRPRKRLMLESLRRSAGSGARRAESTDLPGYLRLSDRTRV